LDVAADFDNFADLWDSLVTGDSPLGEYAGSLPTKHLLALRERLRENARPASDGRIRLVARALAVRGYAGERVWWHTVRANARRSPACRYAVRRN